MQKLLPILVMVALLGIAFHGAAHAADSEESPYVIQQEQAAPVTVTDLPGSEPPAREGENSNTADDQHHALKAYAEHRQRKIEQCEQNNGIDCAREVDIELGAEALQQDHAVHVMRRPDGMR